MSQNQNEVIAISREQGWHFSMLENAVIDDFTLHKDAKLTYMALCRFASLESRECYPAIKSIARKAGISVRQVRNMLPVLVERGYLRKSHRSSAAGDNASNHYSITWNPAINIDLDCIEFSKKYLSTLGKHDLRRIAEKLKIEHIPDKENALIQVILAVHLGDENNEVVHDVQGVVHAVQEGSACCAPPVVHAVHPNNNYSINDKQYNFKKEEETRRSGNESVDNLNQSQEDLHESIKQRCMTDPDESDPIYQLNTVWRQAFRRIMTQMEREKINKLIDRGASPGMVMVAIEQAVYYNKINLNYILKILDNWIKLNLRTVKAVEDHIREFQKGKENLGNGAKNRGSGSKNSKKTIGGSKKKTSGKEGKGWL